MDLVSSLALMRVLGYVSGVTDEGFGCKVRMTVVSSV